MADEILKAVLPANHVSLNEAPQRRKPRVGATAYRVRTRAVESFRRAGITFGPDAVLVDALSLSEEQRIELLNTPALVVEEVGGGEEPKVAPVAKR